MVENAAHWVVAGDRLERGQCSRRVVVSFKEITSKELITFSTLYFIMSRSRSHSGLKK
jgi:hypothetical protein